MKKKRPENRGTKRMSCFICSINFIYSFGQKRYAGTVSCNTM